MLEQETVNIWSGREVNETYITHLYTNIHTESVLQIHKHNTVLCMCCSLVCLLACLLVGWFICFEISGDGIDRARERVSERMLENLVVECAMCHSVSQCDVKMLRRRCLIRFVPFRIFIITLKVYLCVTWFSMYSRWHSIQVNVIRKLSEIFKVLVPWDILYFACCFFSCLCIHLSLAHSLTYSFRLFCRFLGMMKVNARIFFEPNATQNFVPNKFSSKDNRLYAIQGREQQINHNKAVWMWSKKNINRLERARIHHHHRHHTNIQQKHIKYWKRR